MTRGGLDSPKPNLGEHHAWYCQVVIRRHPPFARRQAPTPLHGRVQQPLQSPLRCRLTRPRLRYVAALRPAPCRILTPVEARGQAVKTSASSGSMTKMVYSVSIGVFDIRSMLRRSSQES